MAGTRRTCLQLPDDLSIAMWKRIGEQIYVLNDSSAWWTGDWVVYGQRTFPNYYRKAIEETSLEYQTLRNYAWVARRFPVSRRRDRLSFQHHAAVASMNEEEQETWLNRAVTFGWSLHQLRDQLRAERAANRDGTDIASIGALTISIPEGTKLRWEAAAATERMDILEWIICVLDRTCSQILDMAKKPELA